jgi:hypothetical protein
MPLMYLIIPPLPQKDKGVKRSLLVRRLSGRAPLGYQTDLVACDAAQNITEGFCQCPYKAGSPRPLRPGPQGSGPFWT